MAEQINFAHRQGLTDLPNQAQLQADDEPLSLRRLVSALFRGRRLLLVLTVAGALAGFFLAITKPNTYLSSGAFLVKTGGEQVQPDVFARPGQVLYRPEIRSNAPRILMSGRVLHLVAERVGPEEILAPYDPPVMVVDSFLDQVKNIVFKIQSFLHTDPHVPVTIENAVEHLRQNLSIETLGRDDLIELSYRANSKVRAQRILSTYMDVAQEVHMEVYNSPGELEVIEENYTEAKERLKGALLAMRVFLDSVSVQDFDLELTTNKNELRRLEALATTTEQEIDRRQKQIAFLDKEIEQEPDTIEAMVPDVSKNPVLANLQAELAKQQQIVSTRKAAGYFDSDPLIQAAQRRIKDIQADITKELDKPLDDLPRVKSLVRNTKKDQMRSERNKAEAEFRIDQDKLRSLKQQTLQLTREIDQLAIHKPQHDELAQAVTNARAAEQQAQVVLDLARKKQKMAARGLSSLVLMDHASLPLEKEGPRRMMLILGLTFGAFALGVLLITMLQLTDRTIRTPDDLESVAGIPVLAVIPRIDAKNLRRHHALHRRIRS